MKRSHRLTAQVSDGRTLTLEASSKKHADQDVWDVREVGPRRTAGPLWTPIRGTAASSP